MKEELLQKVYKYIEENHMIEPGDWVGVGVSGGADSMCLLLVLMEYQKRVDFSLEVIHVEHGIRGAASIADAQYVEEFCKKHDILYKIVSIDAAGYAKERGLSIEEAARIKRYEVFEKRAAESRGNTRIAVAHHREDQAETVLWQLFRGSDLRGMGGMQPVRKSGSGAVVIRPLLAVSRIEIEQLLHEYRVSWREDGTNQETDYTRNRIRLGLLPMIEELNHQAVRHICDMAGRMRDTEDYIEQQLQELYPRYVVNGCILAQILELHPLMRRRICYRALTECAGSAKDVGAVHVQQLEQLMELQTGRQMLLPYGIRAKRVYEGILLERIGEETSCAEEFGVQIPQIQMQVIAPDEIPENFQKKYTKYFNYDKIKNSVQLRHRQPGDYLIIDKEGHKKKLKSYLIDEKIPAEDRDTIWLLADGSHILWVIGYRISNYYKVDEHTKQVLRVHADI